MSPTTQALLVAKGRTVGKNGVWLFFQNDEFSTPFRDLLHAANLRPGTDGFTSPPKEGMLRIFSPETSDGFSLV
jgi:hypothetical protein